MFNPKDDKSTDCHFQVNKESTSSEISLKIIFGKETFIADESHKKYITHRFLTIRNILNDCDTSEINLSDTPVSLDTFKMLMGGFNISIEDIKDEHIRNNILEMIRASDFLEDQNFQEILSLIRSLILKKYITVNHIMDLSFSILVSLFDGFRYAKDFLLIFKNLDDENQRSLFEELLPFIKVHITNKEDLKFFKGAKSIDFASNKLVFQNDMEYFSESQEVSLKLSREVTHFPNPNGTLKSLVNRGNNSTLKWDNLGSLMKLSVVDYFDVANFRFLPNLTHFHCTSAIGYKVFNPDFSNCPNLTSIEVTTKSYTSEFIKTIPHPEKIKTFWISSSDIKSFADVGLTKSFKELDNLHISHKLSSLEGIVEFQSLTKVKLRIDNNTDISDLFRLQNITTLCLVLESIPNQLENIKIPDSLDCLILNFVGESYENISFLSNFTKLSKLRLLRLSVDNWNFISKLQNIERLAIVDSNFGDLSLLEKIPKLKYLELLGTRVTNYKCLDRITKLRELEIRSKVDVKISKRYPQKLKYITVYDNNKVRFSQKLRYTTLPMRKRYRIPQKIV
jgi:hypothetical protein